MIVHRTLSALGLAFGLAFLCPDITHATTDLPIYGGLGGNDFRAECPKGSYLVGLAGRAGSWVDRIAPVCAPWLMARQAFGALSIGSSFGTSGGGQERHESCWNEFVGRTYVVQSWKIDVLRSDNHYVQRIRAYCASMLSSAKSRNFYFGDKDPYEQDVSFGPFGTRPPEQACPAKEVAVGIRVRAGKFIDAIGLICGPLPPGPGAPVTKLPDPLLQAPSRAQSLHPQAKNMQIPADMYVIVRPGAGDKIPHGQLVITATEPKVGSTDVVELELRYLDAPVNQQHAYPYTTIVSVNKAQLSTGYPVTERVTGGYVGRWQVRARSTMKTPQGSWSFPVQFHMVKAPPPPPMVQTPKLNAPITQTPAPGSSAVQAPMPSGSATAQMKQSPFMIRPRGVGEKETGNETAETNEPTKTP